MQLENVKNFYQTLVSSKYFNDDLKNKLQNVHNEQEYKSFIKDELLPLAKTLGYELSVDDILDYEHYKLQHLSDEELESVAGGGFTKNLTLAFVSALAITGGVSAMQALNPASAVENPTSISVSAPSAKTDLMSQIREGKTLRHVEKNTEKTDLMSQIKAGKTLRHIDKAEKTENKSAMNFSGTKVENMLRKQTEKNAAMEAQEDKYQNNGVSEDEWDISSTEIPIMRTNTDDISETKKSTDDTKQTVSAQQQNTETKQQTPLKKQTFDQDYARKFKETLKLRNERFQDSDEIPLDLSDSWDEYR